jgi:hypothetical protein
MEAMEAILTAANIGVTQVSPEIGLKTNRRMRYPTGHPIYVNIRSQ